MPVSATCPVCRQAIQVADQNVGREIFCSSCGAVFVVPAPTPVLKAIPVPQPAVSAAASAAAAAARPVPTPPAAPQGVPSTMPLSAVFPACRFEVACATHPGRSRNRNEDSFLVEQVSWANLDQRKDYALICIADGMGGYDAGDQASNLVIRTVGGSLAGVLQAAVNRQPPGSGSTREALAAAIESAIQEANRVVHQKAQSDSNCQGMGATAVVLVLWENQAVIGHVGDCRVYHFRAGQLRQVTKDQTLVARMLELGQISPKEALYHPARNEVAQAVGRRSFLETGRYELNLMRGDWLIAACDGLHTHVEGQQLQDVLKAAANQSAAHLANHLVDLANQQGGSDNITVAAVRCY